MQNLAQLADELEGFDNLDRCRVCNAPKYVSRWTHCGTCDHPFGDARQQEDDADPLAPFPIDGELSDYQEEDSVCQIVGKRVRRRQHGRIHRAV